MDPHSFINTINHYLEISYNNRRCFPWHGHKDDDKKPMCLVSWWIVLMSRKNGGLGVRDLHAMNQSLIAEWIWQWLTHDKWWKETTPSIDEVYKLWKDKQTSTSWKNIAKVQSLFLCSMKFQIGDGKKKYFWEDYWLEHPLKQLYLAYILSQLKKCCTVQEIYHMCFTTGECLSHVLQNWRGCKASVLTIWNHKKNRKYIQDKTQKEWVGF
jgi:hypothetical protein